MEMTRLENWLVNRAGKAERNIARIDQRLPELSAHSITNVLELGSRDLSSSSIRAGCMGSFLNIISSGK